MGLYLGGLIIGRIFASEIWGAYLREGFFLGGGRAYCPYYRSFTVLNFGVEICEILEKCCCKMKFLQEIAFCHLEILKLLLINLGNISSIYDSF